MDGLSLDPSVEKAARRSVPSHEDISGRETRVRTMASDLEALARSGGIVGKAEWKTNPPIGGGKSEKVQHTEAEPQTQNSSSGIWVMIIVGVVVLFLIGFFVLPLLAPK